MISRPHQIEKRRIKTVPNWLTLFSRSILCLTALHSRKLLQKSIWKLFVLAFAYSPISQHLDRWHRTKWMPADKRPMVAWWSELWSTTIYLEWNPPRWYFGVQCEVGTCSFEMNPIEGAQLFNQYSSTEKHVFELYSLFVEIFTMQMRSIIFCSLY